jgi:hypothetical protein
MSNELTKCCRTCPWKKGTTPPGLIGGTTPDVYVAQSMLNFYLPCHNSKGYAGKETTLESTDTKQCAGANIFRANIDVAKYMPAGIKQLPADKETVFATKEEFLAYYYNVSEEFIKNIFTESIYKELMQRELNDVNVKKVNL